MVEDHPVMRAGLRISLMRYADLQIIGEAKDGSEAIELALSHKPQAVLMDIGLPDVDGLSATRQIKAEAPEVAILVLSSHEDSRALIDILLSGADGFCHKNSEPELLVEAIREVAAGGVWIESLMARSILAGFSLSDEQRALLELLRDGLSYVEAAARRDMNIDELRRQARSILGAARGIS